jgi:hypothetical protein
MVNHHANHYVTVCNPISVKEVGLIFIYPTVLIETTDVGMLFDIPANV